MLRARGHELERAFGWGVARSLLEASLAPPRSAERADLLSGPAAPARAVLDAGADGAGRPATERRVRDPARAVLARARMAESGPLLLVGSTTRSGPTSRRCASCVYLAGRLADQPIAVLVGARAGAAGRVITLAGVRSDAQVRALSVAGSPAVAELVRRRVPGAPTTSSAGAASS